MDNPKRWICWLVMPFQTKNRLVIYITCRRTSWLLTYIVNGITYLSSEVFRTWSCRRTIECLPNFYPCEAYIWFSSVTVAYMIRSVYMESFFWSALTRNDMGQLLCVYACSSLSTARDAMAVCFYTKCYNWTQPTLRSAWLNMASHHTAARSWSMHGASNGSSCNL